MLSIDEIKSVSFRKAGMGGYKPEDVDEFIDDVVDTLEKKDVEKKDILKKLDILASKIEKYRQDEETVRNALFTSQKIADTTKKEAEEKAAKIIADAEKKAKEILAEAEGATEKAKDKYEAIINESASLRESLIAVYQKHLNLIKDLPSKEDASSKRKALDEKYPEEKIETATKEEIVEKPVVEEISSSSKPIVSEDTERKPVKHMSDDNNEKFNSLQFGDNYDVE